MRLLTFLLLVSLAPAQTLRLHPDNPRYYEFQGRPTVLVTSAEHYGALLNLDFDFEKYIDTLAAEGMNLTRIFTGAYHEFPGDFGIIRNTLAPDAGRVITPWRETAPGRWNLDEWNPAYFERLHALMRHAARHGIVVEVTLFTAYYNQQRWEASPLHPSRNGNATPAIPFNEALTLKHPAHVERHTALVRKLVTELNAYDNLLWEICNEPYFAGVALDWQRHIAQTVTDAQRTLPKRHLIAQNIANYEGVIRDPDPNVSVFHFHYARPPIAVAQNAHLPNVIGFDESGFDGVNEATYRIQGWDFLFAGGAHYNNLDYSFTAGHEDGTFAVTATMPGYGSTALRRQLRTLRELFDRLHFVRMAPVSDFIAAGVPEGVSARTLAEPGRCYAVYLHHGQVRSGFLPQYSVDRRRKLAQLELRLPAGRWRVEWIHPRTGQREPASELEHAGGAARLATPAYQEDLALVVTAI
jgi:hypothetical protein